jgi:hypothetical protein
MGVLCLAAAAVFGSRYSPELRAEIARRRGFSLGGASESEDEYDESSDGTEELEDREGEGGEDSVAVGSECAGGHFDAKPSCLACTDILTAHTHLRSYNAFRAGLRAASDPPPVKQYDEQPSAASSAAAVAVVRKWAAKKDVFDMLSSLDMLGLNEGAASSALDRGELPLTRETATPKALDQAFARAAASLSSGAALKLPPEKREVAKELLRSLELAYQYEQGCTG